MTTLVETFDIAGYCRISVDEELDRENTSIENQKRIIEDYVKTKFPESTLNFYEDRDRSGYTFEQREGYQKLRPQMISHKYDILIVKDFSRFSRRNSKGLVELEDLRDIGMRIISIGDGIDYPTYDDWTAIQFRFLINEMPVTDASKKVKSVIKHRQSDGRWICAVPYGYVITNNKMMTFEIDKPAAAVVQKVFQLYNAGWGYKKIANFLTDKNIPTPRMCEKARKEAKGEECRIKAKKEWSIITVEGILRNDFYIGTLRQGKYTRKKINGSDIKRDVSDHIVFENHHEPIVDYRTFAIAQEQLKRRTNTNYRGIKINDNIYSGSIFCGDCGSPMFAMSRRDLRAAYTCGTYHRRGLAGCTSHHVRVDVLDELLRLYIKKLKDSSREMIDRLNDAIKDQASEMKDDKDVLAALEKQIEDAKEELKATKRQKIREIMKRPEQEALLEETFTSLEEDLDRKIDGLQNQLKLTSDKHNTTVRVSRIAKTALDVFDDILNKNKLSKHDIELIVERILVYEDRIEVQLQRDIEMLLTTGGTEIDPEQYGDNIEKLAEVIVQSSMKRRIRYTSSMLSETATRWRYILKKTAKSFSRNTRPWANGLIAPTRFAKRSIKPPAAMPPWRTGIRIYPLAACLKES